jgi:adenosine deaminase
MIDFIQNLPKAELHLHIEGTLEPELMFKLAQRNNIIIPFESIEAVRAAYQFSCLQDFLDIYYQGAQVLIHEKDFFELTYAYLLKCKSQNIRHAEIMFDPQTHTDRGISFDTVINGIQRACNKAFKELDISTVLIMSFLRHLSESSAFNTLKDSLPFKHLITAVGLDSSEKGNPPSKFVNVFKAARDQGYIALAHAGEEGPSNYIAEAIDLLKIVRIDHGNRILDDTDLVERVRNLDMALTLCPLSNVALKVVDKLEDFPLHKMLDQGLKITINSDDPAYFGGQLNTNFKAIVENLNLDKNTVYQLAKNSIEYSLLDSKRKTILKKELEEYYSPL